MRCEPTGAAVATTGARVSTRVACARRSLAARSMRSNGRHAKRLRTNAARPATGRSRFQPSTTVRKVSTFVANSRTGVVMAWMNRITVVPSTISGRIRPPPMTN